ncbi:hypothetical protein Stsp01_66400 [Streptomyces sp. NBRC 13847]|uniref:transposase n=1 Tax=Streptomyces TaxID=1883 RepID=UPI00249FCF08|nr:hypothetical protein Stsp01_66400 [Streptomyces sp. NBRC 13847]
MGFRLVGWPWDFELGCGVARWKPWEIADELWVVIEPLLPRWSVGLVILRRKRHPDRLVLGILLVLHSRDRVGTPPAGAGFGSAMTCWRRLAERAEADVWPGLHETLLARIRRADALDFSQAVVDGSHITRVKRGSRR